MSWAHLLLAVAATGWLGCDTTDPCAPATTCVHLDLDSISIHAVDQLLLDVVYNSQHATTTTGTEGGTAFDLPLDVPLTLDLSTSLPITLDLVVAGKLDGAVVGVDATSRLVQAGDQPRLPLLLEPVSPCTEGALYCGGTPDVFAEVSSLYRCTGTVPIFYAHCSFNCYPHFNSGAMCVGTGGCTNGGFYCGGHFVDGDPNTLYTCANQEGTSGRPCARGCDIHGDGIDACR